MLLSNSVVLTLKSLKTSFSTSSRRTFQTCSCLNATNREGRMLMKLLKGSANPKKRVWFQEQKRESNLLNVHKVESLGISGMGKRNFRRQDVLNKLFMRHITDQMSVDSEAVGRGIQITQVRVTIDYKQVDVLWVCDSVSSSIPETSKFLQKYSYNLRHNLSTLRLIGMVPPICFVFDKAKALSVQVERLLESADVGPEPEPTQTSHQSVLEKADPGLEVFQPVPPMRHDVFELNQIEFMNKVKNTMKRYQKVSSSKLYTDGAMTVDAAHEAVEQFKQQKVLLERQDQQTRRERFQNRESLAKELAQLEDTGEEFVEEEEQEQDVELGLENHKFLTDIEKCQ